MKKMKKQKFCALFLVALFVASILATSALAGGNTPWIEVGKYKYRTRFDSGTTEAPCASGKKIYGGHVNLEVNKKSTRVANWHIGWDENCVIAYDSKSKACKRTCYEKKGKGKIGDILKAIDISNSAIKAIEKTSGAVRDFNEIGLAKGASAYLKYYTALKAFIAAETAALLIIIYKIVSCLYLKQCTT